MAECWCGHGRSGGLSSGRVKGGWWVSDGRWGSLLGLASRGKFPAQLRWSCTWTFLPDLGAGRVGVAREFGRPNCVGAARGLFSRTWAQSGSGSPANSGPRIALELHLDFPPGLGRGARLGRPGLGRTELRWSCIWTFLPDLGAGRVGVAREFGGPNCVGAAFGLSSGTWSRGGPGSDRIALELHLEFPPGLGRGAGRGGMNCVGAAAGLSLPDGPRIALELHLDFLPGLGRGADFVRRAGGRAVECVSAVQGVGGWVEFGFPSGIIR